MNEINPELAVIIGKKIRPIVVKAFLRSKGALSYTYDEQVFLKSISKRYKVKLTEVYLIGVVIIKTMNDMASYIK